MLVLTRLHAPEVTRIQCLPTHFLHNCPGIWLVRSCAAVHILHPSASSLTRNILSRASCAQRPSRGLRLRASDLCVACLAKYNATFCGRNCRGLPATARRDGCREIFLGKRHAVTMTDCAIRVVEVRWAPWLTRVPLDPDEPNPTCCTLSHIALAYQNFRHASISCSLRQAADATPCAQSLSGFRRYR